MRDLIKLSSFIVLAAMFSELMGFLRVSQPFVPDSRFYHLGAYGVVKPFSNENEIFFEKLTGETVPFRLVINDGPLLSDKIFYTWKDYLSPHLYLYLLNNGQPKLPPDATNIVHLSPIYESVEGLWLKGKGSNDIVVVDNWYSTKGSRPVSLIYNRKEVNQAIDHARFYFSLKEAWSILPRVTLVSSADHGDLEWDQWRDMTFTASNSYKFIISVSDRYQKWDYLILPYSSSRRMKMGLGVTYLSGCSSSFSDGPLPDMAAAKELNAYVVSRLHIEQMLRPGCRPGELFVRFFPGTETKVTLKLPGLVKFKSERM